MKKKLIYGVLFAFILALGFYCRFSNLENTVVWDQDAVLHTVLSEKFHALIRVATSPKIFQMIRERRASGRFETMADVLRDIKRDSQFRTLESSIPKIFTGFPDWAAKTAFFTAGGLFLFLKEGPNALLYMTAFFGVLILPLTFVLSRSVWPSTRGALIATFLVAVSPVLAGYSRTGHSNIVGTFFVCLSLWPYLKSLKQGSPLSLLLTGLITGIGIGYHPFVLPWFVLLILFEIFFLNHEIQRVLRRTSWILFGFLFSWLANEAAHLAASNISLLFTGQLIKPFTYSLIGHRDPPLESHPFFYLPSLTLQEGILFTASLAAASVYFLRKKTSLSKEEKACIFFSLAPLIFFSVFSGNLFVTLRNMLLMFVPAYLILGQAVDLLWTRMLRHGSRSWWGALIALFLFHATYALKTNWDNAHYDTGVNGLRDSIKESGAHVVFPKPDWFFSLYGLDQIDDSPKEKKGIISVWWRTDERPKGRSVIKEIPINVYDRKIFTLDSPLTFQLWFDSPRRRAFNRILLYSEK